MISIQSSSPFGGFCMTMGSEFWTVCEFVDVSLRLSSFMFPNLNSALRADWTDGQSAFPLVELEETLAKATTFFNVLDGPDCPGRWDSFLAAFPWYFRTSSVESQVLLSAARCLVCLTFNILLSGLLAWVFVEAATESWLLLSIFVFFGWDKLNGMGRVHGFFFLAFPLKER